MEKCALCQKEFKTHDGLHKHVARIHKITVKDYVITHELSGNPPLCECGCGQEVMWNKGRPRRFVHSHASQTESIKKKISDAVLKSWTPERHDRASQIVRDLWQRDGTRQRMMDALTFRRQKMQEARMKAISDPDSCYRTNMSKIKSDFWKVPDNREKMEKIFSTQEFRDRVSVGTKRAIDDLPQDVRDRMSERAADNQAYGVIGPNMTKRTWRRNPFTGEDEHYDSGWEVKFIDEAIRRNIPIKRNTTIRIKYTDPTSQKLKTYVPDFITLDERVVIEVKGMMTDGDRAKITALHEMCEETGQTAIVVSSLTQIGMDVTWEFAQ